MSTFTLPPALEAHEPPEARGLARDGVRMLVSDRGAIAHARFRDLPDLLRPGDVVVINTSRTLPAALPAVRASGETIRLHLSTRLPGDLWIVEPRKTQAEPGETLALPAGGRAALLAPYPGSARLWIGRLDLPLPLLDYLAAHGAPIRYPYVEREWPLAEYQTVYADEPGSAEMPSAGRPFTPEMITRLVARGVAVVPVTLHAGVASLEEGERPHEEWYRVPAPTAEAINALRAAGGRVVAVGTTVVRALETAADGRGRVHPGEGYTTLVIKRDRTLRVVDALLTGFHEPRSTHLAMLEALAGREAIERAYREALATGYLWHEFGDLHLIL